LQVLSLAIEKQVQEVGQMAPECAATFFLYGRALLGNAILKNSVLGEKAEAPKVDKVEEEAPGKFFSFDLFLVFIF
jgi:hypothetical protein